MGLLCSTLEEVDAIVQRGDVIGSLNATEDFREVPPHIGDWQVRFAPGASGNCSIVVAVPTNTRTRHIYNEGRLNWLKRLGYSDQLANEYLKASAGIQQRWDALVAKFVLANYQMSTDTWYQLKEAQNIVNEARELKIEPVLNRPRLMASLNILMSIWELVE